MKPLATTLKTSAVVLSVSSLLAIAGSALPATAAQLCDAKKYVITVRLTDGYSAQTSAVVNDVNLGKERDTTYHAVGKWELQDITPENPIVIPQGFSGCADGSDQEVKENKYGVMFVVKFDLKQPTKRVDPAKPGSGTVPYDMGWLGTPPKDISVQAAFIERKSDAKICSKDADPAANACANTDAAERDKNLLVTVLAHQFQSSGAIKIQSPSRESEALVIPVTVGGQ